MKRSLALLFLVAACDMKPAPKEQPATTTTTVSTNPDVQKPVERAGMGSAKAPIQVSQACVDIGSHVAEVWITSATDPAQRSVYEQERTKLVRATAESCTTQAWPAQAMACYNAAQTPAAIKECEQKFPAPAAAPRPQNLAPGVARPAEMGGEKLAVPVPPMAGSGTGSGR